MRKQYPYLESSYVETYNSLQEKRNFLSKIDDFVNQKQYVLITLLDWNENPIKEIQGELTSGTITKDGTSSVRRMCQLGASVNGTEYSVEDGEMDFAINKKIFIEIGVKNYTDEYPEYPILWFPQGVFFISDFGISSSATSSVNINLTLKDKMCGLNGDIGGKFSATTIIDEMDTQTPSGQYVSEKVLIYDIIQELVNHFGGEPLANIVIEDVPLRIRQVMKWSGSEPLWMIPQVNEDGQRSYICELEDPGDVPGVLQILNGTDAGYIYSDFVYTDELTASSGETVCSVLDKIKSYLGNYEYFYDVFGVFHFREIKNYLNTTQASTVSDDMNANDYLVDVTVGKDVYTFSDNSNLISITATPQYGNIKNDYIVQGLRKMTSSDVSYPVRYHLAIDKKPATGNAYHDFLLYREEETQLVKGIFPLHVDELPDVGNFNLVYAIPEVHDTETEPEQPENPDQGQEPQEPTTEDQQVMEVFVTMADAIDKIWQRTDIGTDEKKTLINEEIVSRIDDFIRGTSITSSGKASLQQMLDSYLAEVYAENPTDQQKLNQQIWNLMVTSIDSFWSGLDVPQDQVTDAVKEKQKEAAYKTKVFFDEFRAYMQGTSLGEEYYILKAEKYIEEKYHYAGIEQAEDPNPPEEEDDVNNNAGGYSFFYWEDEEYKKVNVVKYYTRDYMQNVDGAMTQVDPGYITKDWRTEIYIQGLLAKNNGTDAGQYFSDLVSNVPQTSPIEWIDEIYRNYRVNKIDVDYYFEELDGMWPSIYDLENQEFYGEQEDESLQYSSLTDGNYYLDFIEPSDATFGEFAISAIGRRTDVVSNEDVNCLFQPNIPDVVFLNTDDDDIAEKRQECLEQGQPYTQVRGDIFEGFSTGGYKNGAFDQIKYELYLHTNYQKSVSVTAIPTFYLEPNNRVRLNDKSTNTYGSYLLNTLSIPLGAGSVMSASCSECFERNV